MSPFDIVSGSTWVCDAKGRGAGSWDRTLSHTILNICHFFILSLTDLESVRSVRTLPSVSLRTLIYVMLCKVCQAALVLTERASVCAYGISAGFGIDAGTRMRGLKTMLLPPSKSERASRGIVLEVPELLVVNDAGEV
jgi:hypothetical protein